MVRTPWGYDAEELPPIATVEQFDALTGGAFAGDDRAEQVEAVLASVSAAIRNWCGWHIAPVLECEMLTQGPGEVIDVPSLALWESPVVRIDGVRIACETRRDGFIRCTGRKLPCEWQSVYVQYYSGYDLEAVPDLAAVVAQMASNQLAASPGVQREQVGQVSLTYNATSSGVSGGISLLDRDRAILAPYRLPSAPR